jgi:hypothetical protein
MKIHDLDLFSLVFGTIFALGGLTFLLFKLDVTDLHLDKAGPVVVMAFGLLIVGLSVRGSRRRDELERESMAESARGSELPEPAADPE